jgi:uncharacterized protein DUF4357
MPGRSIRLFLIDGTGSGLRTAELGLSTIKALVVPRASLSLATQRSELQRTGVYILIGPDTSKAGLKRIYIGEGDIVLTRLSSHNKDADKDFWEDAIVFTSKDQNLTKAHVRYLEARLIELAELAKRATIANGTEPTGPGMLPEPDEVEMEEFIVQTRLLLGTLGFNLFDPATPIPATATSTAAPSQQTPEFHFQGEGYSATCRVDTTSGQFVVTAGSTARREETASLGTTYRDLRQQLLDSGVLQQQDGKYVFTQDYAFTAISGAAQVVSGFSINGRIAWKTSGGSTYADWEDAQLPNEA